MLHGFRMSAEMMRQKMPDLLRATEGIAEWHFIDGANEATGPVLPAIRRRYGSAATFEWWNARESAGGVQYAGLERSCGALSRLLQSERFDVLAGYSQGAAMVAVLTAMLETARLPSGVGWSGSVLFNSGPPPRDDGVKTWFPQVLETKSLHVLGGPTDIAHDAQLAMSRVWSPASATQATHTQGHTPPSEAASPAAVAAVRHWLDALAV
jgi:hypothetical protein